MIYLWDENIQEKKLGNEITILVKFVLKYGVLGKDVLMFTI